MLGRRRSFFLPSPKSTGTVGSPRTVEFLDIFRVGIPISVYRHERQSFLYLSSSPPRGRRRRDDGKSAAATSSPTATPPPPISRGARVVGRDHGASRGTFHPPPSKVGSVVVGEGLFCHSPLGIPVRKVQCRDPEAFAAFFWYFISSKFVLCHLLIHPLLPHHRHFIIAAPLPE